MPEEAALPDEVALTLGARTYHEAALYVASFLAYVRQHALDGRPLPVELVASGLSPQDQRVLR